MDNKDNSVLITVLFISFEARILKHTLNKFRSTKTIRFIITKQHLHTMKSS